MSLLFQEVSLISCINNAKAIQFAGIVSNYAGVYDKYLLTSVRAFMTQIKKNRAHMYICKSLFKLFIKVGKNLLPIL